MSSDSMLPPPRPGALRRGVELVNTLLGTPVVQWALLLLAMLVLLALTKSSIAESPYNNF